MFKWLRKKETQEKAEVSSEEREEGSQTGLWAKFRERLARTRERLQEGLEEIFEIERAIDEEFFEEIEEALITADINIDTVRALLAPLRIKFMEGELTKPSAFK
jgi:fused signal recognition particle receptor